MKTMTYLPSLTLEKQGLDLASTRRQMIFGLGLIWLVCLVEYAPIVSTHITNILLLFASAMFVCLTTLEITGRVGNRLRAIPAIWSGLLFVVYPLHPEAGNRIFGRVDLLCTLFYLAAIFSFLRYQLLRERKYLTAAVLSFLCSALCLPTALTLPAVALVAGLLLPGKDSNLISDPGATVGSKRALAYLVVAIYQTFPLWLALGAVTLVTRLLPHDIAAGLEGSPTSISTALAGFLQPDSLNALLVQAKLHKIVVPVPDDTHLATWISRLMVGLVSLAGLSALVRMITGSAKWQLFLFLIIWCGLAELAVLNPGQITQDLHSGHFFFPGSGPWCILVALACEPGIDALSRRIAVSSVAMACILQSTIFLTWSYTLQLNLIP